MFRTHTAHLAAIGRAAESVEVRIADVPVHVIAGVVAENKRLLDDLAAARAEVARLTRKLERAEV